ncbi:MAG: signal peptidase I [Clostridia bacterium]|jgi:signal peptidase I
MSAAVKKELMEWVSSILIAVILAFVIRVYVFEFIQVIGISMVPTLKNHDWLLVEKISYRFRDPQRGDIIILKNPGNLKENFVKRVIGVENDVIEVRDGYVYVNQERIEEPYINEQAMDDFPAVIVPEDSYFVMGDNRNRSKDSRDPGVGFIPREDLLGRAVLRIWPLQSIRWFGGV